MENQDLKKWILRIAIVWMVLGGAIATAAFMGMISKQDFMITFLAGMVLFAATTGAMNNQMLANRKKEEPPESEEER